MGALKKKIDIDELQKKIDQDEKKIYQKIKPNKLIQIKVINLNQMKTQLKLLQ